MLGKIIYKKQECTVVDTIHSIRLFDDEEVTLHGHLRDYIITKNEVIVETEVAEFILEKVKFVSHESLQYFYEQGVINQFLTEEFIASITQ